MKLFQELFLNWCLVWKTADRNYYSAQFFPFFPYLDAVFKHVFAFLIFSQICFSLGAQVDSFHTPPTTPQNDGAVFTTSAPQLPSSPTISVSSIPPVPVTTGKKSQHGTPTTPSARSPPPDWKPRPPVSATISSTVSAGVIPVNSKPAGAVAVSEKATVGRNGGPPTSTPRIPVTPEKSVPISPIKSPSSLSSASPVVGSSLGQNWRERDSGLSRSLPQCQEPKDGQSEELEKLLEECKLALGITASEDGSTNTAGESKISLNLIVLVFEMSKYAPLNKHCNNTSCRLVVWVPQLCISMWAKHLSVLRRASQFPWHFLFYMHVMLPDISVTFPQRYWRICWQKWRVWRVH